MVNHGAVTVLQTGSALSAFKAHGPFLALRTDKSAVPRSRPAKLVQAVVVDAEMVGDLVDHGHRDLVDHLVL